jgi:DNA ligase (NAD+)
LVNRKKVHDSSDLFLLKKEDLLDLDGFAEKSAKNLLTSIELSKNTSLHKFIYSLGIREVGEATALNLSNAFESVGRIASASKEELLEINDIGPIAANFISEFFEDNKTKVLIKNFLEVGIILKAPLNNIDSKLNNKVIVITGSFTSISRSQLKEELIRSGVKVTSSVSTNTDYLVAGDKPGSKLSKAEELNVTIISEETILDLLG